MRPFSLRNRNYGRLRLEPLEQRELPAGNIDAAISGGVLTLTGDDLNNAVTIQITATDVIVTPDATTSINGGPVNTPVNVAGVPTSLKASFLNGDDAFSIFGAADLILPKGAVIDLGGGNNTLGLATTTKLELGGLTIKGGDGIDSVTISAGAGLGKISKKAALDYGAGSSSTVLAELAISAPAGLKLKSTGGVAIPSDIVTATNVQIDKGVSIATGGFQATFAGSTLGKVTGSGSVAAVGLTNSTVDGGVKLAGAFQSSLTGADSDIGGSVDVKSTSGFGVSVASFSGPTTIGGNVKVSGFQNSIVQFAGAAVETVTVGGAIDVKASAQAVLGFGGPNAFVKKLSLSGAIATASFGGQSVKAGNISVKSDLVSQVNFATTALSEVDGSISMIGTGITNSLTATSKLKVNKNVTLKIQQGANIVSLGDTAAALNIGGNLKVEGSSGIDQISLIRVAVAGSVQIKLGAGTDSLQVSGGSAFAKTFSADMGTGDDVIALAQAAGIASPVTFTGKAAIKAGDGNDTLLLGVNGGDAGQAVTFAAGSVVDGGTGLNTFDDELASFTGIALGTGVINWTDPT